MPPKSPSKGTRGTPAEEPKQDDGSERELMEKELVIAYMKSKLGRYQANGDRLQLENIRLMEDLDVQKLNLRDINEFLTNELKARSLTTNALEAKLYDLNNAMEEQRKSHEAAIAKLRAEKDKEIASQAEIIAEFNKKAKVMQDHIDSKEKMDAELASLKAEIEALKLEFDHKLIDVDRQHIQDREKWKRETAAKIKETKIKMMKLTDNQLEMTTKQTILENEQMSVELSYQSRQTEKLLSKNTAADGAGATPEPQQPKKFLGFEPLTWAKILPLGMMFFCILFNYTILRDTKDVLVVTAPGSGAEIIPFLKTYVNLPMAIGFTVLYAKLANVLSSEALFYTCIIPFIIFFGSFAGLLYPMRDVLHPTAFCESLLQSAGQRWAGPIAILRNWTFCLFYVMAELWGSVVVSVLFWGFANQITTVEEASQFYPLFGLGANVALIFSGQAVRYFSEVRASLPPGVDGWGVSLAGLMGMVVVGGLIILGIYWALQRKVVPVVKAQIGEKQKKKKSKAKMSVGESFAFLAASPYIRDLALLVVSYGISINLVEVTWKSKIKAQFPNPNDYSVFMGNFSTATGTVTFLMMLLSRVIFKKFGWGTAALITPTLLLITGLVFFSLLMFPSATGPLLAQWGMTPLYAAVLVGAAQNIFSKSAKYSLFDPCKEMAYIPLDDEVKTKGKAAIDVICNPLGKSGGALIQQFMIIGFGSLAASTPYLGAVLLAIVLIWIQAAASLNKQFTALQTETGNTMDGLK